MDVNYSETDWIPENGSRHGYGNPRAHGHNWRPNTCPFTPQPHEYRMHPSPSHARSEAIPPQSLATTTLPSLNTIINTELPSSPFSPLLRCPNMSYLRPHPPHNREIQHPADLFSHNHHPASSGLQLPSPQISASRGPTPVSRPISTLSWNSEGASISTLPPWPSQFQESFIDLTTDSSSPMAMPPDSRKRSASGSRISDYASVSFSKRARLEDRKTESQPKGIAELDLREIDDDKSFARVIEEQRKASVKAQHELAEKPVTFSNLQCIICMEPMTNITVTHCGHLFCHSCLMEALIAGEQQSLDPGKGFSKCPVCRKKVARPKDYKPSVQVIPLEIKVRSRKSLGEGKGKAPETR